MMCLSGDGLGVLEVKGASERIKPDFAIDRVPWGGFEYTVNSGGHLVVDVEVYATEDQKNALSETEAIGQPVVLERDLGTVHYTKYVGIIADQIKWQKYIKTNETIYLCSLTLIAQEMEGV